MQESCFSAMSIFNKDHRSIYLIFLNWGITATMIHPTFASLVAQGISLGVLFLIRGVAHGEGRRQAQAAIKGGMQ